MKREIGRFELELDPVATRKAYDAILPYAGRDVAKRMYLYCLNSAGKEAIAFLEELGVDPKKVLMARPLAEPDENGEVLFLCTTRLCGKLIRGEQQKPRSSEEEAGLSMVFIGDKREQTAALPSLFSQEVEMRFVLPLAFDPEFFKTIF